MKLTRHNGRSGKNGTYNPRHNDRRFDVENSEHIDAERARQNVYWDCYRGFTTRDFRENPEQLDFSFEEIERMYYYEHYADHVNAQNARNEKTRHIERNRTVDDLLKNNKTCPEESIYQIGTMEESVPPETLALIVSEFYEEFENRFDSHIHILDWALHLDEGTPHIHERHVFDCENRYGELCPQQEKALEELGIPLPKPEQPKGKHNNRKQTFDAVCRTILFDIAKRHGLHLEQEPSYGGRDYLEKQDYILMKQKEKLAQQEQNLEELTLKIEDVDSLIDEVSSVAYDKAVELVTDEVKTMTHQEDIEMIEDTKVWLQSPERKAPQKERDYAVARLDGIIKKIRKTMQSTLGKVKSTLLHADKKQAVTEEIKKQAKPSIVEALHRRMEEQRKKDSEKQVQKKQKKQDMEL
ncbi:MAG: serine/arginine repetitive matrix protein 2 [Clostridiaceae bacterium]|nr:serine/arginine repetitive matrix protein 2 [Clostridiaceae bacterium]